MSDGQKPALKLSTLGLLEFFQGTGLESFRIGYTDESEGLPIVWWVSGRWKGNRGEADAALTPDVAVERLAERVLDGGLCMNCHRPTMLVLASDDADDMIASAERFGIGDSCFVTWNGEKWVKACGGPTGGQR